MLVELQKKCGATPDGVWGPQTYRKAREYFKLTNNQAAHFFGQCAHESANFTVSSENLNYSSDGLRRVFPKYFVGKDVYQYARKPEKIANLVYGGRMGNVNPGDGWRFRGRGPIQLTGRSNYTAFSKAMNRPDVLTNPDIVSSELAFESALWFFRANGLLELANRGVDDSTIILVTRRVNGGTHGLEDRLKKTKQYASWA